MLSAMMNLTKRPVHHPQQQAVLTQQLLWRKKIADNAMDLSIAARVVVMG